jgi:uncharacterized NAD(P)/FAD-binding protein YdhS
MSASVAIVGAGPRGICILERIIANADELLAGPLRVHLVDPHPPGGGRVWRAEQSPLLLFNSAAADVTLFMDDTVRADGPIRKGPTIAEWAQLVRDEGLETDELSEEVRSLEPGSFPSRQLGNAYFTWFFARTLASLPTSIAVEIHEHAVVDITERNGRQILEFDDGTSLIVDGVVLTIGHLDADPEGEHLLAQRFAERHDLRYLPPAYGADVDLSHFVAGEDVIVRGFGLAFVDIQVLLTEGRGGRFEDLGAGRLRYHASGDEPRLHVGSRRGVPYMAKPTYDLQGPPPPYPRFFTKAAIDQLVGSADRIEFRRDVWPLLAKEIAWGGYHELFAAHPDRVGMSWEWFDDAMAPLLWGTAAFDELVASAVPAAEDRIDFVALDRPLAGLRFADGDALQRHLADHIRADIDRRSDPRFSADLGAFNAFLSVFALLPRVLGSRTLSPRSFIADFDEWWFGFFSYYASGPPPRRLEELLALARAGVVRFLGAGIEIRLDETSGRFEARSASSPDVVVASALIDATLPKPTVSGTRDPLVRSLAERGEIAELVLSEHDGSMHATGRIRVDALSGSLIDAKGERHPRRFALGQHTVARAPAFARPNTNAPALRANDHCARELLKSISTSNVVVSPELATGGTYYAG